MSSNDFERRFKNFQETMLENQARFDERQAQFEKHQAQFDENMAAIAENQARFDAEMLKMQEAIAGLIQVARIHNEQITALQEQGRDQQARLDALIRIVEGHVSNHP
jgi:hypothetical protein